MTTMTTRDAEGSYSGPNPPKEYKFQEQETPQIKVNAPSSSNFELTEPLHQQPTNNAITHPKKKQNILHLSLTD